MQIQNASNALPSQKQAGVVNNPGGTFGEQLKSNLAPDYYTLTKAGRVFGVGGVALNPAAFVGGAAGTPLIGLYNPAGSQVDLVLVQARLAIRTTGTAAATAQAVNFWSVNQGGVAITGTQTQAKNMYSQAAVGSAAYAIVNAANTGALASTIVAPSFSLGNIGATAGVNVTNLIDDNIRGLLIVPPGGYLAWGMAQAFTAGSVDAMLIWAETPV